MHKVGDKFEIVSGGDCYGLKVGDILTFYEEISSCGAWFKTELGKLIAGGYEGKTSVITTVRPLPTSTTVTGPATITVAAGETITFEGNATVKQDWVPKFGDRVVFVDPPKDMVGEFGVVTDVEYPDEYGVTYNDGSGSDRVWLAPDKIKPYEAE